MSGYDFQIGEQVRWKWGEGHGEGKIKERYTSEVTKELQGAEVTRDATEDEPAYLVEQEDGDQVLKSTSELEST